MSRPPIVARRIAAVLGALGVLVIAGPLLGGSVVGVVGLARSQTRRRRARRALDARRTALPEALDLLVVGVHAGLTPHQAVELAARHGPPPLRPVFSNVVRRTERGDALADALAELPGSIGPPAVAATDALAMAQRHGTPLHDAPLVLAAEANRQRRARIQRQARRLPILLSFPLVTCVLPAFVLLAVAPVAIAALTTFDQPRW